MDMSERSSRKHQRPQGGSKGAPIELMMLPYGARARAPAPCASIMRTIGSVFGVRTPDFMEYYSWEVSGR